MTIVEQMRINPRIQNIQLSDITGYSERAVRNHLEKLKDHGVIERAGGKKNGPWTILKDIDL